ncbi:winged helix-turn-helix transcriptional regulator [Paenibacillus sp. 1P07SE]|uniref:winged helix-turn-helix transcriptional regulator n=1 Tax=Paenibacillus sp. 1P07SE TaxID=3132209 RepID=UPI0039A450CA
MRITEIVDLHESKESSLIESFEQYLVQTSTQKHTALIREMDCWQGRADVVAAYINKAGALPQGAERLISRLGPAQVLAVLYPKKKRALGEIISISGLSESTVKRHVKELVEAGLIQKHEADRYTLHPEGVIPQFTFHAYEGKLHNWRRALYQAINYLGFAQYSSVVMPKRYIKAALENIEYFKINGIGLISVTNQQYHIHLKPRKHRPRKKAFHLVGVGKALGAINESKPSVLLKETDC